MKAKKRASKRTTKRASKRATKRAPQRPRKAPSAHNEGLVWKREYPKEVGVYLVGRWLPGIRLTDWEPFFSVTPKSVCETSLKSYQEYEAAGHSCETMLFLGPIRYPDILEEEIPPCPFNR